MKLSRIYIDTSVVGGCFDKEFEIYSKLFFERVDEGRFKILVSDLLNAELSRAPDQISSILESISKKHIEFVEEVKESEDLAHKYLEEEVVGKTSFFDCRHIALATYVNADILVSWNFKHIVNVHRIRGYNSVNLKEGYNSLEIRTPREALQYED